MACLIIAASMALADKLSEKKQMKREKQKAMDSVRCQDLQTETKQRLARTQSGNVIPVACHEMDDGEGSRHSGDEAPPPSYTEAVKNGRRS